MLAIGFNLLSNFRQLLTGQQEGRGTFEPLQQPFSVLIVVAWLVVGAHWFRPPAASLHKIQTGCVPCSDNAAHRGEARGAGGPVFMQGVMAVLFCIPKLPHSHGRLYV